MVVAKELIQRALILCFLVPSMSSGKLQSKAIAFTSLDVAEDNSIDRSRGILRESLSSFTDNLVNFFYSEDAQEVQAPRARRGNNRLLNVETSSF